MLKYKYNKIQTTSPHDDDYCTGTSSKYCYFSKMKKDNHPIKKNPY